jgi:hypothetical protein
MQDHILEELYKPFTSIRERKGQGNKTFRYVESNDVIDRMNRVFKGNWSVNITYFEIIEDNILVRVQVVVPDQMSATGPVMNYTQEAFASHPLARFTGGDRKGQIVDLGNSYRAAVSKALKAAVSRWGVALNMDEDVEEGEGHAAIAATPLPSFAAASAPVPTPVPQQEKVVTKPPVAGGASLPPFTTPVPQKPVQSSSATPFPVHGGSEDRQVSNAPPVIVPTNKVEGPEQATDVQKVALETILQMNGLKYDETARKVLEMEDFPPIEKLSYMQAVKMIQYGNNLKLGK